MAYTIMTYISSLAMISAMDCAIGDVMVALKKAGLYDDTFVAFSSDVSSYIYIYIYISLFFTYLITYSSSLPTYIIEWRRNWSS